MKTVLGKLMVMLATITIGAVMVPIASAGCADTSHGNRGTHFSPLSWDGQGGFGPASFLLASDRESQEGIVGFWRVAFTAKGNPDIPDGTPIDTALVVLHSDGIEIMNSGRPAQDGNICMGVWEKTGWHRFRVNHFTWGGNDTTNAPTGIGNPTGPTHLTEKIWLSPDGNSFAGTFVLDATDTSGKNTAHILGVMTATRITIDTKSVF